MHTVPGGFTNLLRPGTARDAALGTQRLRPRTIQTRPTPPSDARTTARDRPAGRHAHGCRDRAAGHSAASCCIVQCSAVGVVLSHRPQSTVPVTGAPTADLGPLGTSRVVVGGRYATKHENDISRATLCVGFLDLGTFFMSCVRDVQW